MKLLLLFLAAMSGAVGVRAQAPSAATLAGNLRGFSLDPNETYHVRDVQISRGDIKLYLTEGTLSFATGVAGHGRWRQFLRRPASKLAMPRCW